MDMCNDMQGGGGHGITLIIVGGKPPMPPGHSLSAGDHAMAPPMDVVGDDSMDLTPPKDAAPKQRPMMNARNLSTKRDAMKPRSL